jgi:predicted phosphoadenosine phosphosulfate sulfurtransferase
VKIYQAKNVYEAALERIEFLYNEFPIVTVCTSGGKDSTVVLHLCIEVARKLNRLPVNAWFLDQEAEWFQTVEYQRTVQAMPEVDLKWWQVPFDISCSTGHESGFLNCWRDGEEWMRPKEPDALEENIFDTNRFHTLVDRYLERVYPGQKSCKIGGMRCEESPTRSLGLTVRPSYKHVTWGKFLSKEDEQYIFHPIYDWELHDVWHYIAINNLPYNKVYDLYYQNGVHPRQMRVSCLVHEIAVVNLEKVQHICKDTWEALTRRISSANSIKHLKKTAINAPEELPFMFRSWMEYRDYLLENLIQDDEIHKKMVKMFGRADSMFAGTKHETAMYREEIRAIIRNDYSFTGLVNFMSKFDKIATHRKRQRKLTDVGGASYGN